MGDIVSVNGQNGLSGTVTKIRIRSTSIRDFERKELIVPNKDLVRGQLLNWTLSDAVQRVVVPVGIAYGSDTDLAEELLWKVLRADSRVLEDPAPQVLYTGFGDSALEFEVRAFSPTITDMIPLRHDLHKAIDKAFREAGIEIAFPQRDLHFRGPLEIVHRQEDAGETP
ncbi:MAG: mechanosensitive ion channel family protein [Candidatus Hydrogenedentota bacterium]